MTLEKLEQTNSLGGDPLRSLEGYMHHKVPHKPLNFVGTPKGLPGASNTSEAFQEAQGFLGSHAGGLPKQTEQYTLNTKMV